MPSESDDTPIWRYMDLARYVMLLDRGLFFSQASSFTDPWEGSLGGVDFERFRASISLLTADEATARFQSLIDGKRAALSSVGVSCWHYAEHESAALWELYVAKGLGVAIKSTVGRVLKALPGRLVHVINVEYREYGETETGTDPASLLRVKRRAFAHEREVRFLTSYTDDELQGMKFMSAIHRPPEKTIVPGWRGPLVISGDTFASCTDRTAVDRSAPNGIHAKTDLECLIDRVVLAPSVSLPTRRADIAVTKLHSLNRHVIKESEIDTPPYDRLRILDRSQGSLPIRIPNEMPSTDSETA